MENLNLNIFGKILASIIIILFAKIIGSFIAYILIKMFNLKEKDKTIIKQNVFYKTIKSVILLSGVYFATFLFVIPNNIKEIIIKVFKISIILVIAKGFSNLFNINSYEFKKLKNKINFHGNDSFILLLSKILKIVVYIIAGFMIVSEFGYNLGGLFTGLGISSVVIALAAQDLAKSLFGGLSILFDKPFVIGDYIKVNDYEGTVEYISFRSTRIRNLSSELIVIPNSQVAENLVVNCTTRDSRQYELNLVLELSTSLNKISDFKEKLLLLLDSENHVLEKNKRIFFDTVSDNGYNLNISFYTDIITYNDFLQFKEEMNFKIMQALKNENIELAYDTKTIYLQK